MKVVRERNQENKLSSRADEMRFRSLFLILEVQTPEVFTGVDQNDFMRRQAFSFDDQRDI